MPAVSASARLASIGRPVLSLKHFAYSGPSVATAVAIGIETWLRHEYIIVNMAAQQLMLEGWMTGTMRPGTV